MDIITEDNFDNVIASEKPVLVDFYADWCGPCRILGPMLKALGKELADVVTVVKFDFEDNSETIPDKYDVRVLPTLVLFKQGKEVAKTEGVLPRPKLKEWIESHT